MSSGGLNINTTDIRPPGGHLDWVEVGGHLDGVEAGGQRPP